MNSLFFCVYDLLTLYTGSYIANKKYVEIMQIETKKQKKKKIVNLGRSDPGIIYFVLH